MLHQELLNDIRLIIFLLLLFSKALGDVWKMGNKEENR